MTPSQPPPNVDATSTARETTDAALDRLWNARPRSRFVRASLFVFFGLLASAWFVADLDWGQAFNARRMANLERFAQDIRPAPVRHTAWDWGEVGAWMADRLGPGGGGRAWLATLAISVLAIVLAGWFGTLFSAFAARNLMAPEPFPVPGARAHSWGSRAVVGTTRIVLVLMRCLPEYLLAFFFVAIFGLTAWPAVLALVVHNTGILGRLQAETIENIDPQAPRALRDLGASRFEMATTAVLPAVLPRNLLYFFYRWETCVREATVLGMLNIASLGQLIDDARESMHKADMLFFVLCGATLVLVGDLISAVLRRAVRRAS